MEIPPKLRLGGHDITVDCSIELQGADGEWNPKTNTINICSALAQSQKESALIHEIMHVMNAVFNQGVEHLLLDSLANQLYAALKDNDLLK